MFTESQISGIVDRITDEIPGIFDCHFSDSVIEFKPNFYQIYFAYKEIKGYVYFHAVARGEIIEDFKIVNVTGTGFHVDQAIFEGYDYEYEEPGYAND